MSCNHLGDSLTADLCKALSQGSTDYISVAVLFLISNSRIRIFTSNSSLQLRPGLGAFAGCPVLQGLGLARLGIWTRVT